MHPRTGSVVRRLLTVAVVVLTAGGLLAVGGAPARANWYGATDYAAPCPLLGNMTDNKDVHFFYVDPQMDVREATNWVRRTLLDPSSLETFTSAEQTHRTDVVMIDRYYETWCEDTLGLEWTRDGRTGLMGVAACYSTTATGRCQQQVVRVSNRWFDSHWDPGDRWLVCHEVGHAIGLMHRDTGAGCMLDTGQPGAREYTIHDLEHVNGAW